MNWGPEVCFREQMLANSETLWYLKSVILEKPNLDLPDIIVLRAHNSLD